MDAIAEIKSRLSINDVLHLLGIEPNRSNFVHSIYKSERTPSLKIYPETNTFYCYATNQGGDQLKLYCDYCRIDIKQAIKELSERLYLSSVNTSSIKPTVMYPKHRHTSRISLFNFEVELFEEYAAIAESDNGTDRYDAEMIAYKQLQAERKQQQVKIFESLYQYCIESGFSDEVFNYLTGKNRGLTAGTLKQFKIFEIKRVDEIQEFLRDTFHRDDLIISGLFSNKFFLFTKHRIIIPYIEYGRIVYLRGRYFYECSTLPEGFGKYISCNNKSGTLSPKRFFNQDILKLLAAFDNLLITEGEFDCMIASQQGNNAIGIPGVANFPVSKTDQIKNFNLYLTFDSDAAGQKAINDIRLLIDKPLKIVRLKNYKDLTEMYNATTI